MGASSVLWVNIHLCPSPRPHLPMKIPWVLQHPKSTSPRWSNARRRPKRRARIARQRMSFLEMKCEIDWDVKWMYMSWHSTVWWISCVLTSWWFVVWFSCCCCCCCCCCWIFIFQGWVISFSPPCQVQACAWMKWNGSWAGERKRWESHNILLRWHRYCWWKKSGVHQLMLD